MSDGHDAQESALGSILLAFFPKKFLVAGSFSTFKKEAQKDANSSNSDPASSLGDRTILTAL